jgi:hypothetical protein
MNFLRKNIAKA